MTNNTQHTDHFEELCAGYVLNALEADEHREFEELLQEASDEEWQTYYAIQSAANQIAFTTERAEPSEAVINRILRKVNTSKSVTGTLPADETESKSSGISRSVLAMAASFALLLVTLALVFYSFNLNSEINTQQAQITELKNENQRMEEMLSILEARTVDLVVMSGLEVNPSGYGKVIWDPEKKQALLQVSNMPAVPKGKAYQLWLIKNNKPTPAGVFAVNNTDKGSFFKVEQLADANQENANAFAITLEPEGGSKQPTGDMYMLGNVPKNTN